jgi:hypothetical protein
VGFRTFMRWSFGRAAVRSVVRAVQAVDTATRPRPSGAWHHPPIDARGARPPPGGECRLRVRHAEQRQPARLADGLDSGTRACARLASLDDGSPGRRSRRLGAHPGCDVELFWPTNDAGGPVAERMAWPSDRPIVQRMTTGGHTLLLHVALSAERKSSPYTS